MDVEADAEELLGHRRALDVPAGASHAPRRRPARVLAGLVRLPQREVERILLALGELVAVDQGFALVHVLELTVRERAVARV